MRSVSALGILIAASACAPKPPDMGGVNNKDQPNVAEETGRSTVLAVSGPSTPLIVDWAPEMRADLEEAMHDGVAVVAFDPKGLRLLKRCRIDGKYGFVGVTTKYQLVQLESADEVRANLPLAGATIIAKLGAELEQGKTLDVAMAMIGKKRTTWRDVTNADLQGDCAGATHFVRGATVGAFVLDTGTRGKARAAAEVLGAGASYATGGSKKVHNADGSLDACKLATPEGEKPPSQCAALIRLELEPIEKEAPAKKGKDEKREVTAEKAPECPEGMVLAAGKCAPKAAAQTHLCTYKDAVDCQKQCDAGDAGSCNNLGVMLLQGDGVTRDPKKADQVFLKACEGGEPRACVNLALRSYQSDPQNSLKLAAKGCFDGNALGCELVGEAYYYGQVIPKDTHKALRFYKAACDGGNQAGCTNLGLLYAGGASDIPKNEALGIVYTKRACDGGVSTACGNLGLKYEFGVVVKKDEKQAVELFERACRMSGGGDCLRIAIATQSGFGVKKDDARAKALYQLACRDSGTSFGAMACGVLNLAYGDHHPLPQDAMAQVDTVMKPQCEQDVPRACTFLGVAHLAQGKNTTGEMYLNAGCKAKDYWACDLKKRLRVK